jgi:hypothetical protein
LKPRVYIETTIIGYLASRPSRDIVTAANQQLTREWWEIRRTDFDLFASQFVLDEASQGDRLEAERRINLLVDIPILLAKPEAEDLANALLAEVPLPARAAVDAAHIALATVHGMDFLLTWNCKHIANAALTAGIERACRSRGFEPPVICTPQQLEVSSQ